MTVALELVADEVDRIVGVLHRARLPLETEKRLQWEMETRFLGAGLSFGREHPLGDGSIIDFIVRGGIGIEVKIKGSRAEHIRQLTRYAASDQISYLILVTAKSVPMPETVGGKPLRVVCLAGAWL